MKKYKDKELLDFLQLQNEKARYTGKCIFRLSSTDRGWRLHETKNKKGNENVREAIFQAMIDIKNFRT